MDLDKNFHLPKDMKISVVVRNRSLSSSPVNHTTQSTGTIVFNQFIDCVIIVTIIVIIINLVIDPTLINLALMCSSNRN